MTLRPFFSYFGAKWRLARQYPEPTHDRIIEAFAGSAGYSLRFPDRDVILVEKNKDLCAMWRFLIRSTPKTIRNLPLLSDFDHKVEDMDLPCRGARILIGFWMVRSAAAPASGPTAWMKKHHNTHPGSFWGERVRERLAQQVPAIKHWSVIEGSYDDLENEQATWFVDPPYQVAGKSYVHGSDTIDYDHLGNWCRSRNGQVIVCENEGAKWLPFRPFCETKGTRKQSREVVWTSK